MIRKIFGFLEKYERHISSATLVTGFIIDSLTLRRADLLPENLALISYLLVVALCITLLSWGKLSDKYHPWLLFVMQFCFGGLSSAFLVFYSRSTSIEASWPFLLLIIIYMISNEVMKKHYSRFVVRACALFFSLFSYFIFLFPVIFKQIGTGMFFLGAIASVVVFGGFLLLLLIVNPKDVYHSRKYLIIGVVGIFVSMNALYFFRLIPPIPLMLKDAGAYHLVERLSSGNYITVGEKEESFPYLRLPKKIHIADGNPVYIFASIFSPTDLNTSVLHIWQHYDEEKKSWETLNRVTIPISGGREDGYRTYSTKNFVPEGKWRVDVETEDGMIIGRINFSVNYVLENYELISETK